MVSHKNMYNANFFRIFLDCIIEGYTTYDYLHATSERKSYSSKCSIVLLALELAAQCAHLYTYI